MNQLRKECIGKYFRYKNVNHKDMESFHNAKDIIYSLEKYKVELSTKQVDDFITEFNKLEIDYFKEIYGFLKELLDKDLVIIFTTLKDIDNKLELNTFLDNETFTLKDIVRFFNSLNSKTKQYSSYTISRLNLDTKEEYLVFQDGINNKDEKVLDRILKPYRNWYKKISNSDDSFTNEIFSYLESKESLAVDITRSQISYKVGKFINQEEKEIGTYVHEFREKSNKYLIKKNSRLRSNNYL